LKLNPDTLVEDLSVAQQQTTEIAKALSRNAEIIIMDEPTSSLTGNEIENLLGIILRLKNQGKTIILITHKLDEAFRVSDTISVLRDGHHIATLEAAKTSPDEIVNMMVGRSVESIFTKSHTQVGEPILEVKDLSSKGKFKDISFTLHKGEVLGFSGLIGAGRTEVARAIFGADPIDSGEIWINGERIDNKSLNKRVNSGIGLVPEDRKQQGLVLGMSLGDNLVLTILARLAKFGLRFPGKEKKIANGLVRAFR
jgi:ABC-type sugar transport system ATPase subunit